MPVLYDDCISSAGSKQMTIQPFVENAIEHGITKKIGGGTLYIETQEINNKIAIIIKDDGVDFDAYNLPVDCGVNNCIKRYNLLSNNDIDVFSEPGLGTKLSSRFFVVL